MFSDKRNINILTSLLIAHGVKRAVVCPGSRNAPIVNNLNECDRISCYPVTDERSAGFYALGMSLADNSPVAVCVTSGTALLNLAPAVAEASYRHHGLIVISADRPKEWIEQLDGQTLPQVNAFGRLVGKCVTLPEPSTDDECWYCNRLVNEALISVKSNGRMSVHINVPISEPLFNFPEKTLPKERVIQSVTSVIDADTFRQIVLYRLSVSERPVVVAGQLNNWSLEVDRKLKALSSRVVLLAEPLSSGDASLFDLALLAVAEDKRFKPDFILYVGDTLVSKRLKIFLRGVEDVETWAVSSDGEIHDTFKHLAGVVCGETSKAVDILYANIVKDENNETSKFNTSSAYKGYVDLWNGVLKSVRNKVDEYLPEYSQMAAVREFELSLINVEYKFQVHYANSTSVRLANIYSRHHVWCNRGVNGIEGSLSTAAGHSVVTDDMVFCVIGDLSFFYDQNALWNTSLKGNLRVILLNNGCGGIFYGLKGLKDSGACDRLVAAQHNTSAKGICVQNDVDYFSAHNTDELSAGLAKIMKPETSRPMLLEVFTDKDTDELVMNRLIRNIIKS